MSKIDELRKKYNHIRQSTFDKIVDGDITKSKKYVEVMLRFWSEKKGENYTLDALIETINEFDEYLPYLEKKDIYSKKDYPSFFTLQNEINIAKVIKDDKTFVKEDHIDVLYEDDNLLILHPKTHRGSVKYGRGTRWCTAASYDVEAFNRYSKNFLIYVISKKKDKSKNHNKLGIVSNNNNLLFQEIYIYNEEDKYVSERVLICNKWTYEEIYLITMFYTQFKYETKVKQSHIDVVKKHISAFTSIKLSDLSRSVEFLKASDYDTQSDQKMINDFIEEMRKYTKI